MKVYRLQTEDDKGPWRGMCLPHGTPARYFELRCEDSTHPNPWMDHMDGCVRMGFVFASPSMEILKEWFDPFHDSEDPKQLWMRDVDMEEFKKNGFNIYVYETDDFKIGNSKRQVAFNKKTAQLLEILPLELLFKQLRWGEDCV